MATNNQQVYTVVNSSPEITTVGDYCAEINGPALQYHNNEQEFLNITNEDGISNLNNVQCFYDAAELAANQNLPASQMLIKPGTVLYIPINKIDIAGLLGQGIEVTSNNEATFKAKALADLEADPGYNQIYRPIKGKLDIGITKEMYPDMTVWIWCRALSDTFDGSGAPASMEGELLDITPFISKINTSNGKNGGNFSITLPPLVCTLESTTDADTGKVNNKWAVKKSSIRTYADPSGNGKINYVSDANMFNGSVTVGGQEYLKRSSFLFHTIINTNDLIFIRFETLNLEAPQRYSDKGNFYINKGNIAGRIYDMIGLVDTNTQDVTPGSNDVTINITGRDLIKLFIEDGTYFYDLENVQGQFRIAGSSTIDNQLMQRLIGSKANYFLSLYQNLSIEYIIKFIIQQLSTISVIPDNLLYSYGDRRNTRYTDKQQVANNKQRDASVQDLIKAVQIDITNLSTSISNFYGNTNISSAQDIYNRVHSFLLDIRAQNKRILTGNSITSGWSTYLFNNTESVVENLAVNQFPICFFNDSLIMKQGMIYNILDSSQSEIYNIIAQIDIIINLEKAQPLTQVETGQTQTLAAGIWQIIKLVIDSNVTQRRIVDSSMSSANGSLLNFIRKACQEPFVEFYTDTYGDQFYIIIRKPPTDKLGITTLLAGNILTDGGPVQTAVMDIEIEDVIKENLYFDDKDVYSWYNFKPQNVTVGGSSFFPAAYTPAIYFEEYARIWGSRPLELSHNYNPYTSFVNKDGIPDISRYQQQAMLDYKYIIESHAYLPFTRKGTIVTNGDRRYKKGNLVRNKSTNEIFMIDAVSQDESISANSIDRTTTLSVSRGMIEPLIYGVDIGTLKGVSYFNIIDTNFDLTIKQYSAETTTVEEDEQVPVSPPSNDQLPNPLLSEQIFPERPFIDLHPLSDANKAILSTITNPGYYSKFAQLIGQIQQLGYGVILTSAYRTIQQQELLYAQNPLNAKPGYSAHNYGRAVDMVITNSPSSGAIAIDKSSPSADWMRTGIPQLAKQLGFIWGGDAFTGYFDPVHFEIPLKSNTVDDNGNVIASTQQYQTKKVSRTVSTPAYVGIDIEKALSNIKVNQEIFNYFLRREQMELKEYIKTSQQSIEQRLPL